MDRQPAAVDLGHGVSVRVRDDGLEVESRELELEWQPGAGHLPGTAVMWQGEPYEVVARLSPEAGWGFRLEPWPEGAAMRTVVRLDGGTVAERAAAARAAVASARVRRALTLAAPVTALAPEAVQTRWRLEHGYPAVRATYLSAISEIGLGTLGVLQLFASAGGGGAFLLPGWLGWLGPVGPFVLAEGLVRLVLAMSHHQPAGSLLGLPLLLLERPRTIRQMEERPRLLRLEPGELELASPILRRDWEEGGLLLYRDRRYLLDAVTSGAGGWCYRFREAPEAGAGERRLRLEPPASATAPAPAAEGGALRRGLGFVVEATLMSLAPGALQRVWSERHELPPRLLAGLSAAAELLGGAVNLAKDSGGGGAWILLDLVLLAEGAGRTLVMVLGRGPVGSVLGLPLLPLLRRWAGRGA